MRKVNKSFVHPTGPVSARRVNEQAKRAANDQSMFEHGRMEDGSDWSRNDTRGNSAPRYEESVQLLHQLSYGPRLRPHRA